MDEDESRGKVRQSNDHDRSELERAVFAKCSDPVKMARLWERIVRLAVQAKPGGAIATGGASSASGTEAIDRILLQHLFPFPNPERCLLHLDRFLEASFNSSGMAGEFIENPAWLDIFFQLVSTSTFLADTLVRDPQLFRYTVSSGILDEPRTQTEYLTLAREAVAAFPTGKHAQALRRFQRRELLYIAAADILGKRRLEDVTFALSCLADSILEVLLERSIAQTMKRLGTDSDLQLCILALGKHGGGELNYSSDIDIMLLYREDGMLNDRIAAFDAAGRIVETLVHTLTTTTADGFFYRTDLRLRPDGGAGAPALSVLAAMQYYEIRGTL